MNRDMLSRLIEERSVKQKNPSDKYYGYSSRLVDELLKHIQSLEFANKEFMVWLESNVELSSPEKILKAAKEVLGNV